MIKKLLSIAIVALLTVSCYQHPVTGRKAMLLQSDQELATAALSNYKTFLYKNQVVSASSSRDAEMVKRVGERVVNAVKEYYKAKGIGYLLTNYSWEVNLVQSAEVNAWCLPGGKIVVYTGLLPVIQSEAAMAAIMGHEVSHALFSHGNERLSQLLLQELSGSVLQEALAKKPQETKDLINVVFGQGSKYGVLLPFERSHELEADRYGMRWMAMAGYDPREAVKLWERMKKASGSDTSPEFLSNHPSDQRRIEQCKIYLPEALAVYRPVRN